MKCFITLATIMAVAAAEAQYYPLPLARTVNAYRTVSSLSHPGAHAFVGGRRPLVGVPAVPAPHFRAAAPFAHAAPIAHAVPVAHPVPVVNAAPVPIAAPALVPLPTPEHPEASSQFHAQDEFGNYEYGYSNINSAKRERGNAHNGVEGSYSYVDGYGVPQQVSYVADDFGFRVAGTNIPVSPATHGRKKRQVGAFGYASPFPAPLTGAAYAGLPIGPAHLPVPAGPVAYASPVVSAPAVRKAILTTVQLNPGHAVSYRVD